MALLVLSLWLAPAHAGAAAPHDHGTVPATQSASVQDESASPASDLDRARSLLGESQRALEARDFEAARAKAAEAVGMLLDRPAAAQDESWVDLLESAGSAAFDAQDVVVARQAWRGAIEYRERTLADDDLTLQRARGRLANVERMLGDLERARTLEDQVLEVFQRKLPGDHRDLQVARANRAVTAVAMGDLERARELHEAVLESYSRTLPADHADLQRARRALADTLNALGRLDEARDLGEAALEACLRTLPEDHVDLQRTRITLGTTLGRLGELEKARSLVEAGLAVFERTLPTDHPTLLHARMIHANVLSGLGRLSEVAATERELLAAYHRLYPDEHPTLQHMRANLAASLYLLGRLEEARQLQEKVLEVLERQLSEENEALQYARENLALTLFRLGDMAGARALEERVVAVFSRTLAEDHPDLQRARTNLGVTLEALGELETARALQEKVLEVCARKFPDEHLELQLARSALARTLFRLGDREGARGLESEVLEIYSRTLPEDHPYVLESRSSLASMSYGRGDLESALALQQQVLQIRLRTLPNENHQLQVSRALVARTELALALRTGGETATEVRSEALERAVALLREACRAEAAAARAVLLTATGREARERSASLSSGLDLDLALAVAVGPGRSLESARQLEAEAFSRSERTRSGELVSGRLARRSSGSPRYAEVRERLVAASQELVSVARRGTGTEEYREAARRREQAERELTTLAESEAQGARAEVDLDSRLVSGALAPDEVAIAFRYYQGWSSEEDPAAVPDGEVLVLDQGRLCAFVVHPTRTAASKDELELVDLGPVDSIRKAVESWRLDMGVGGGRGLGAASGGSLRDSSTRAAEIRRLAFDPLLARLGEARHLTVVLDDVLHLVPIDALPLDDGTLIGDRWQVETRASLAERLGVSSEPAGEDTLFALGGAAFDSEPLAPSAAESSGEQKTAPHASVAAILRGGAWENGFQPLSYTGPEARAVAALHAQRSGSASGSANDLVLEDRRASRAALEELGPRARWLHVATHGWFAPESIPSWMDVEPVDKVFSEITLSQSGAEQVRGMSPMLLCGLALAGANLAEDEAGHAPGVITAEELSALDLGRCELAVLSACDTSVGERRAGQGVASLQAAMHMAGARSVITSLWKVPDEPTKDLMLDFYRRLWVEEKPKWQALWEAKVKLRDEKDEAGNPRYSTRDWAAWVLTGDPN